MIHIWNFTIVIQKRNKELSDLYAWNCDQFINHVSEQRDKMIYQSGHYSR